MARWSPFDPDTDRRLVRGLNEGDEGTIAELYAAYAERLYDYCVSLVCDKKIAADIVHDCLIDAGRRAPRMRDRVMLRPWLYGAARRRCLQRGCSGSLHWTWTGEDDSGSQVPVGEQRMLVEATVGRLGFLEQEALLLAMRHAMTRADLAAITGVPSRRAHSRISRARSVATAALRTERRALSRRCSLNSPATQSAEPARPDTENEPVHGPNCAACLRRNQITVIELLNLASVPAPPAALRRRVVHTATDPELAAHRADIVGRGGNLTAQGMPVQPDVASPLTRRWALLGSGAAGALISAVIAALIIGPGLLPSIYPFWGPDPSPSAHPSSRIPGSSSWPVAGGPANSTRSPSTSPTDGTDTPAPTPTPTPTVSVPWPGRLGVDPINIKLASSERVTYVNLTATGGRVTWEAVPSTYKLSLSEERGTLPQGATTTLTITLDRELIELRGHATITVTSADNPAQTITVSWDGSIFT